MRIKINILLVFLVFSPVVLSFEDNGFIPISGQIRSINNNSLLGQGLFLGNKESFSCVKYDAKSLVSRQQNLYYKVHYIHGHKIDLKDEPNYQKDNLEHFFNEQLPKIERASEQFDIDQNHIHSLLFSISLEREKQLPVYALNFREYPQKLIKNKDFNQFFDKCGTHYIQSVKTVSHFMLLISYLTKAETHKKISAIVKANTNDIDGFYIFKEIYKQFNHKTGEKFKGFIYLAMDVLGNNFINPFQHYKVTQPISVKEIKKLTDRALAVQQEGNAVYMKPVKWRDSLPEIAIGCTEQGKKCDLNIILQLNRLNKKLGDYHSAWNRLIALKDDKRMCGFGEHFAYGNNLIKHRKLFCFKINQCYELYRSIFDKVSITELKRCQKESIKGSLMNCRAMDDVLSSPNIKNCSDVAFSHGNNLEPYNILVPNLQHKRFFFCNKDDNAPICQTKSMSLGTQVDVRGKLYPNLNCLATEELNSEQLGSSWVRTRYHYIPLKKLKKNNNTPEKWIYEAEFLIETFSKYLPPNFDFTVEAAEILNNQSATNFYHACGTHYVSQYLHKRGFRVELELEPHTNSKNLKVQPIGIADNIVKGKGLAHLFSVKTLKLIGDDSSSAIPIAIEATSIKDYFR